MSAQPVDVLAYGVVEREGGPIVALKYDREDASDWIVSASSEYRNRQMPGPSYRVVELIDHAAVAELIEAADELCAEVQRNSYAQGCEHMGPWVIALRAALGRAGGVS